MTENYSKQPSPDGIVFAPHSKRKTFKDRTGQVSGYLTVIGYAGHADDDIKKLQSRWWCKCICGTIKIVQSSNIANGETKSCGCMRSYGLSVNNQTHGQSNHDEYHAWDGMRARCTDPNSPSFHRYGGRGISVCDRWTGPGGFERFFTDLGKRPSSEHSLGRIDNDGNYEPGNVRWEDRVQQARNKSSNRMLEFNGKRQCYAAWTEELGWSKYVISQRIDNGWSVEDALTVPPQKRAPRSSGKPRTSQI